MLAAAQGLPAGWVRQEALSPDRRIPRSIPCGRWEPGACNEDRNEPSRSRCLPGGISGERACGRRGTGRNERVRRRGGAQEPGRLPGEPQGGTEDSQGLGLPGFHVLQATAAGDATGNLAIVVNSENPMIIEREVPGAGRLSSERLQAWRRSPAAFFGTCPTSQWVHSYVTTTRSPVSTSPRTKVRSGSTLCRLRARSLSARSVRRWIQ